MGVKPESLISSFTSVLREHREQSARLLRTMSLFGGKRTGSWAGYTYYRFEVPEETIPPWAESAVCRIGLKEPITLTGRIVELENQFLTIALPMDFGIDLPELQCTAHDERVYNSLVNLIESEHERTLIASHLFFLSQEPGVNRKAPQEPRLPEQLFPEQRDAVEKAFKNTVTVLWGPFASGKSHTLALIAVNAASMGKSVLVVTPSNSTTDALFLQALSIARQLQESVQEYTRYDVPSTRFLHDVRPYSFHEEVEALKEKKREVVRDKVRMLEKYWNVKRKQVLHEHFYGSIQNLREHLSQLRGRIANLEKEIAQYTEQLEQYADASLLQRMKKGMSREEGESIQKKLTVAKQELKHLNTLQAKLGEEITLRELDAPISVEEWKEYREALKQIEELGGVEAVQESIDDACAVNENMVFLSKRLVCTSVASVFVHQVLWERRYDVILVDDAQCVPLPTLYALASLAREAFVLAGDPFELTMDTPALSSTNGQGLSSDIFHYLSHTHELHKLFEWTKTNEAWVVHMKSHIASVPKISSFVSSVLYDDTLTPYINPSTKGKLTFIDTSPLQSECKQYIGKKRILPYNEQHTRVVLNCVKHALMNGDRTANDIGIIFPFVGPTLYTKLQLRVNGMQNIEVGTPSDFVHRKKRVIIFDTTMAGVDYTMRSIDDKKVGEYRILRLLNTVCSCVQEECYILADLSHFKNVYRDRLITRLLLLLHAEADVRDVSFDDAVQRYQSMESKKREALFQYVNERPRGESMPKATPTPEEEDAELALRMKMMSAKKSDVPIATTSQAEEKVYTAVHRVLGYWRDSNLLAQFAGQSAVFHSSIAAERNARTLPFELCSSDKQFRSLIEKWNHLLYELSGGNDPSSPWCTPTNIEARPRYDVYKINAVLNSRVEAYIKEGKQKLSADVNRIFQEILSKAQPSTSSEWETFYISLLSRMEAYLSWIEEQLRKG